MLVNHELLDRINDAECSACYAAKVGAREWEWTHQFRCIDCGACDKEARDQPLLGRICRTCTLERLADI